MEQECDIYKGTEFFCKARDLSDAIAISAGNEAEAAFAGDDIHFAIFDPATRLPVPWRLYANISDRFWSRILAVLKNAKDDKQFFVLNPEGDFFTPEEAAAAIAPNLAAELKRKEWNEDDYIYYLKRCSFDDPEIED